MLVKCIINELDNLSYGDRNPVLCRLVFVNVNLHVKVRHEKIRQVFSGITMKSTLKVVREKYGDLTSVT